MKKTLYERNGAMGHLGRPRTLGVPRERNGRRQRETPLSSAQIADNQSVVRAYRERVFGVDPAFSTHQLAGTFIGRLHLRYRQKDHAVGLSEGQYRAAVRYRDDQDAYARSIGNRVEYQEASGLRDPDPAAYEAFCARARDQWEKVRKVINDAVDHDRTLDAWDALWQCVVQDQTRYDMVGALRETLNVLDRFYSGPARGTVTGAFKAKGCG